VISENVAKQSVAVLAPELPLEDNAKEERKQQNKISPKDKR
jgi:hypothetical protein